MNGLVRDRSSRIVEDVPHSPRTCMPWTVALQSPSLEGVGALLLLVLLRVVGLDGE